MFLLFSHKLTPLQIKDAKETFGIDEFIYLPKNLQDIWSQIPPEKKEITSLLLPIKEYLLKEAKDGDVVLIQGDFGATYDMVNFCKSKGYIAIYSTNKRVAKEVTKGDKLIKISEFIHKVYRRY